MKLSHLISIILISALVGIASTLGTAAGVLGNIISGIVLDLTQSWTLVFFIAAGLLVFGGFFYLLFASDKKQFD